MASTLRAPAREHIGRTLDLAGSGRPIYALSACGCAVAWRETVTATTVASTASPAMRREVMRPSLVAGVPRRTPMTPCTIPGAAHPAQSARVGIAHPRGEVDPPLGGRYSART